MAKWQKREEGSEALCCYRFARAQMALPWPKDCEFCTTATCVSLSSLFIRLDETVEQLQLTTNRYVTFHGLI